MEDTEVIKRVIETGEVSLGYRGVHRLVKEGKPKVVIISSNCPQKIRERLEKDLTEHQVPIYNYNGTSLELGEVCRKPFPIAAMAITNPGNATITQLIKGGKN